MNEKNKIFRLLCIMMIALLLIVGVSYAAISYNRTGANQELVLGDIWLKYEETNEISLVDAFPGDPYSEYFEFRVTGTNTYEKEDIWYDVILSNGEKPSNKEETYRIDSKYLKFKLVEVVNEKEIVLFTDKTYNDLNNRRIYVDTIPKNTKEEYNKTYRIYMTLSEKLKVGNTTNSVVSIEDFSKIFASVKVNVTGDLKEKSLPGEMKRFGSTDDKKFWSSDIINVRENIKEVKFLELSNEEINKRYNEATIKSDLTTSVDYPIKSWLEINLIDSSMYTMYIASNDDIYFPSDSSSMFYGFSNVKTIDFNNVDTSQATSIRLMFANCQMLNDLDLSGFDTSKVTDMFRVFQLCESLESLDLNNWDTSNVTDMQGLFHSCYLLKNIYISNFDTSKVTDMAAMFYCNFVLESIDLSNWDTSQVIEMTGMFANCTELNTLDLSNFDTSNVTDMSLMFFACVNLNTLDISNFTFNKVTNTLEGIFAGVGYELPSGMYTTVYVKSDYIDDGTTYSPQEWILNLSTTGDIPDRPSGWSTVNVIVK